MKYFFIKYEQVYSNTFGLTDQIVELIYNICMEYVNVFCTDVFCSSVVDVVRDNNCALLKLLVAVKGGFSVRDAERGLLIAAENGYTDCVDVLLQAGINPEVTDSSRGSALSAAVTAGHDDVVRYLAAAVSRSGLNAWWRGSTALHRAVASGRGTCVGSLVDAGASVNSVDSAGDTPLIVAAKHCRQSLATMKYLIGAGCDLERVDAERRTALHYSCYRAVGAELLLSAGAKTNVQVTTSSRYRINCLYLCTRLLQT